VSKVAALSDASLAYSDLDGWGNKKEKFLSVMSQVWRTRGYGDYWSHMLVAEGAVDIAAEPSLALWDMAALDIIVREAGGRYSSLEGVKGPFGASGVSSNGALHEPFLNALK
jgi:histidinol-phosphatase